MSLVGLDLNDTCARGVSGPAGMPPLPLHLDGKRAELPLALSLEGRTPVVGRVGLRLCRRLPHLACLDFLAQLGGPALWTAGRHRLDAAGALTLVLDHLRPACAAARGLALALPAYLGEEQVMVLAGVAERLTARTRTPLPPLLGSVAGPLAVALTAHAEQPWSDLAVVADADDHALTWAAVAVADGRAELLGSRCQPQLGLRAWKERLLNGAADRCIRQSRRDPRDLAPVEQALWEQLETVLDDCSRGGLAQLKIEADNWYQHLMFRPEELAACCTRLVQRSVAELHALLSDTGQHGLPGVILVTDAAARLPGLVAQLEHAYAELKAEQADELEEDFGADLLDDDTLLRCGVCVLAPDAAARAAHELACRFDRGDLPGGHLLAAPLPPPQPPDVGPPRLLFRGQEYRLRGPLFTLGRQPGCDLVFDSDRYPMVSARHCEIVFDRRSYLVRDRSRNGTLVNDRPVMQQMPLHPGDWIRLGPDGPQVRYLGKASDQRTLMTTA
jgi:hypothetical protein